MNSNAPWVVKADPSVAKALKRIPKNDKERLISTIQGLENDPYAGDIQKIKGEENVWRRRIGSYRIFYEIAISENLVLVFHVERRTSTTY